MYDIIIIGAGTAGLSAAIYASRAGKTALVLESKAYGGQIINTPDVENYPGIKNISGFDFATGLYEQAKECGAVVKIQGVLDVKKEASCFVVSTKRNTYEGRSLIIATGASNRPLGLEREKEMIGKGISYCATCDGAFFKGKDVAVIGGGNTALEDAGFLSNYCNKVYIVHRRDAFRGEPSSLERLKAKENVELVLDSVSEKIIGDETVSGLEVKNVKTGEKRILDVSGIFVAIGQVPQNELFKDLVTLDSSGYVVAGEDCRTSMDGVFVAGDCRTKKVRQLTTAASDGAVAALAACEYVDSIF
ncbi:MAG: thioredoxin-disulfide reductase [Lachnospiraceae bacterium]|nr:thioredoxin-disulfide reductase [Lachnospiraceae bacterium]